MSTLKSKTFSVTIESDPRKIYDFVSNPANLPKWAKAFCRSVKNENGRWVMDTPLGEAAVRFCPPNDFGLLDHTVTPAPGVDVFVPMRVVANGTGSEVIFTLFQLPQMPEEKFDEDIRMVGQDLNTLKEVMEG